MALTNQIKAIPVQDILSSELDANNWTVINESGLPEACNKIIIVNGSNELLEVSYDGTTRNDVVKPDGERIVEAVSNSEPDRPARFAKGLKIYLRSETGTGGIFLIGYYQ